MERGRIQPTASPNPRARAVPRGSVPAWWPEPGPAGVAEPRVLGAPPPQRAVPPPGSRSIPAPHGAAPGAASPEPKRLRWRRRRAAGLGRPWGCPQGCPRGRDERRMAGGELPGRYVADEGSGRLFRRGRLLGEGAFGRCYRLTEVASGRVYAAKVIPRARLAALGIAERVERERELQGRLCHRHVVRLHGHFADRGHLYLLLELCGRGSLADILRARGTLTEPEARYYLRQGIAGLRYLHGQGVVHRDLKPSNVLVTERMQVKIGDLGLARQETAGGRRWGYAVLTGSPPFPFGAAGRQELYGRIRAAQYPLPARLSPQARALLGRLLVPEPAARASLGEVLDHGFFTQGFTPDSLPPHACRAVPVFCLLRGAAAALARRWEQLGRSPPAPKEQLPGPGLSPAAIRSGKPLLVLGTV
ncbi:inactive serine/threonine-protein kinase PLK5-like isoform X2 [Anser cygnoides]|uniref:inactive serine/threonine-protein kinase PLK5-like isoform X2 n=1 Tax=Anser cygnoides TaxID=8845 RepID=UPI0034D371FF